MRRPLPLLSILVASALALAALPMPAGQAEPTPGVNLSLTRIVPEAYETNDFISLAEARGYLAEIEAAAPEHVTIIETGPSYGLENGLTGGIDTFQTFAVEVTHEGSATPREDKKAVVFQLSIHGNEKGGREGGLRVIEDLALARGAWADYEALLDEVIVVFTFPNVDGWMHEEVPYRVGTCPGPVPAPACVDPFGYTRGNGRGADMNRDWPSLGWVATGSRMHALSEPEIAGQEAYLIQFAGRTLGATDIHGMMVPADGGRNTRDVPAPLDDVIPQTSSGEDGFCIPTEAAGHHCTREGHFTLGLLAAVPGDASETLKTVRLSERSKAYLNTMAEEHFAYWGMLPNLAVAGGEWNEWGTGWDTIGYSDSGFTGDWFGQFLEAPGLDFELSYNHVTFDNHYIPEVTSWHVESTRAIVRAFLDEAQEQVRPALTLAQGGTIAWLHDDRTVTGDASTQEGPHQEAEADDAYETSYEVNPQYFWRDLAAYLPPGTMVPVSPADVSSGAFHQRRTLVISDDAWDLVADDTQAVAHLRMHLDQGGRLLLTDGAVQALEALELAEAGSVEEGTGYLGFINLDRDHAMVEGVRGLARETYNGIPLGFPLPGGDQGVSAPIWTVAASGVQGLDLAGTSLGEDRASLGRIPAGDAGGEVAFIGALVPTPTQMAYHPYGLADYAVTYTGYQLVYNALGITLVEVPDDGSEGLEPTTGDSQPPQASVPGPAVPLLLAALLLGAALVAMRRRR